MLRVIANGKARFTSFKDEEPVMWTDLIGFDVPTKQERDANKHDF